MSARRQIIASSIERFDGFLRSLRRFCLALALILCGVGQPGLLCAESSSPSVSITVAVSCEPTPECVHRVQGQLSDLDGVSVSALSGSPDSVAARVISEAANAEFSGDTDLVVVLVGAAELSPQLSLEPGAHIVVLFARDQERFSHRLGARLDMASPADSSATLELFALDVRSAARAELRAQRAAQVASLTQAESFPTESPSAFATTPRPKVSASRPSLKSPVQPQGSASTRSPSDAFVAVDTIARLLSFAIAPVPGLAVGVGVTRRRSWFYVNAWAHLAATVTLGSSEVALEARGLAFGAARVVASSSEWQLAMAAEIGAEQLRRSTSAKSERVSASASLIHRSVLLASGLVWRYSLDASQQVVLKAHLEWVPSYPKLVVLGEQTRRVVATTRLVALRPFLSLGWLYQL